MTSQNAGAALARDRLVVSVRRWFIALVATALSTYTLDAFATTTGVLLAASHLLQGLDFRILGCFLAITYGVWWLAMRENLAANWALLQDTGTSTNVLSKVAHDSTALWTQSARARRFAASVGYVGTELVKETPYYAGAFGAALVSDAVSAGEALIFLGGANLGAAAYEFALARGTSAYLERRTHSGYAAFETDWRPAAYLTEYYASVEPDEQRTIAFFIEALRKAKSGEPVLFLAWGRRCTTSSRRRQSPRKFISRIICPATSPKSSAGWRTAPARMTGGRLCATPCNAKASTNRARRR